MDFKKELENNKEEYLNDLFKLLSINSILDENDSTEEHPFGTGVRKCLDEFVSIAERDGFSVYQDGGYACHVDLGEGEKIVGSLCHIDVVPVSENWNTDPFKPVIIDGKIFARGAIDDKGPLMAFYSAMKLVKAANIKLKNKIRLIVGCDEETAWRGLNHYWTKMPKPEVGISPDADFPLIYGEKGIIHGYLRTFYMDNEVVSLEAGSRLNIVIAKCNAICKHDHSKEFELYLKEHDLRGSCKEVDGLFHYELIGVPCHAMQPEKGKNAASYMCDFLKEYTELPIVHFIANFFHNDPFMNNIGLNRHHEYMGDLTCNLGRLSISKDGCIMGIDVRYPKGIDFEEFYNVLNVVASGFNFMLYDFTDQVPHYIDPNEKLVTGLYDIYVKHTGDTLHKPMVIGGGTYARSLTKGVAFGMEMPGEPAVAHEDNEYVKLENFYKAILIYVDAILFLGEIDA